MSLADQFKDFNSALADFRQEMFGATAAMADAPGNTFACYYSPATETEMLMPFGIQRDFDLVLRVKKTETNFVPEIGKNVKILAVGPDGSDLVARLVKPRTHALGVEHVFECKSQS
jgi:hypothetical protein